MGIKRETLLIGVLCLFAAVPAFADQEWLIAQTDKDQYSTGQDMEISGFVMNDGLPQITIKIYDPENDVVGAYNVELEPDDTFTKIVSLDSPSYDQSGLYLIEFQYGDQTDDLFFEVVGAPKQAPTPISQPGSAPEVLLVTTDKGTYHDNDFVTISGLVSDIDEPTILIGIFDPDNFPAGFYTPKINSDQEFEVSFLAKSGINFKKTGTYTIKANYGTSKITTTFGFADQPLAKTIPNDNIPAPPITPPPQIILNPTPVDAPKPADTPKVIPKIQKSAQISQPAIVPTKQSIPQDTPQPIPVIQNSKPTTQNEPDLTPKEKEIGEVLNKITLDCDGSSYTDSIIYGQGMGPALMRLCNYDQAVSYFERALAKDPYNPEILTNLGSALSKQGKFDDALQNYNLALKKDPNYISALNNKANVLAETGNLEQAITIYNKILDQDRENQLARQNLQKAKEEFAQYAKIQAAKESVSVNLDDSIPKIGSAKVNYDKASFDAPKPGVLENIGTIFAGIFGFWK
ncbi:MAG: tetratricopeptide repeat protein [Thaumarchaeota archaeon]|nr:tetratricopeptide repeat protein [Nitrososphaerota archaeon]